MCLPHHWRQCPTRSLQESSPLKTQTTEDIHKFTRIEFPTNTTQTNILYVECRRLSCLCLEVQPSPIFIFSAHRPLIYCILLLAQT